MGCGMCGSAHVIEEERRIYDIDTLAMMRGLRIGPRIRRGLEEHRARDLCEMRVPRKTPGPRPMSPERTRDAFFFAQFVAREGEERGREAVERVKAGARLAVIGRVCHQCGWHDYRTEEVS